MTPNGLEAAGRKLTGYLASGCRQSYGFGSMTAAVYDTAWVSMILKTVDGKPEWLFPECFKFILDKQLPNGGWQSFCFDDGDILNTLAALLSLKKHLSWSYKTEPELVYDLEFRTRKAVAYLQGKLEKWDVTAGIHVGFEVLVPALFSLLKVEGVVFSFQGWNHLMALNQKKLVKFDPRSLYGETKTTLLHSLEAFVGRIDFDRVEHHLVSGSMMASPSSTAAYIMYSSKWNDDAETYLRTTLLHGDGKGSGGVPSAFPTSIFETTWILTTLLHGGFSVTSLDPEDIKSIASYLEGHLEAQNGLLGFAPNFLVDADDTAKALLALRLLGRPANADLMISKFRTNDGHLQTYVGERNSSFSANCNVLIALLHMCEPDQYVTEISTITTFLCESWWKGTTKDKWNLSPQYSMMLLAEALMRLLELWDDGMLRSLPSGLVQDRVPVVCAQILNRTLLSQSSNGAWGQNDSPEITSYSVLTLLSLENSPFTKVLKAEIVSAIKAGRDFLELSRTRWTEAQYIWIEKVTYGSSTLSQAYCLAAMNASKSKRIWSDATTSLEVMPSKITKLSQFFSALPAYSTESPWKIKASALEGLLFLPDLKRARPDIFPRQGTAKEKYLDFIPCTWTLCNNCDGILLNSNLLWDMMMISMLDFLVDEYMEAVAAKLSENNIKRLDSMIRRMCDSSMMQTNSSKKRPYPEDDEADLPNGFIPSSKVPGADQAEVLAKIKHVFKHYVQSVLDHPSIEHASPSDKLTLRSELQIFLLAHLLQIQDNDRFSSQDPQSTEITKTFLAPRTSYYDWVHTTAAEHISCPFSFAFYTCLIGSYSGHARDCFPSARQKYLARDLCSHLAVMSRLYNDYASIARDRAENNLNTVNFPEFRTKGNGSAYCEESTEEKEQRLKMEVLGLAEYERELVTVGKKSLVAELRKGTSEEQRAAEAVRLFVSVTELYAEMYVLKDLTNRVK